MNSADATFNNGNVPSRSVLFIRSLLFWFVFATSLVVYVPLVLLCIPLPFRVRYGIATQWARVSLRWLSVTCKLDYRVSGEENIPETTCIVFSKHQSTWETLALQKLFPPQVWVLKRELLWLPLFGWGLATMKPIAINRGAGRKAVEQLVAQGTERLKEGLWVVVFPEGTRIAPGRRGRYRIGGAVLAERSRHPVIPVAHNAGEFWPRRGFIKLPGTIDVVIGKPITTDGKDAATILKEAETWIESTMESISRVTMAP